VTPSPDKLPPSAFFVSEAPEPVKVSRSLTLRREIPGGAEVLVHVGESVEPATAVALRRGDTRLTVLKLETDEDGILGKITKEPGERCVRGETVCFREYLFGLGYREYVAPSDGVVESIDYLRGHFVIREDSPPTPALVAGTVTGTEPGRAVLITTPALRLTGAAGLGEPASGTLLPLETPELPDAGVTGTVLCLPGAVDRGFLLECLRRGAAGVVCASAPYDDLASFGTYLSNLTYEEFRAGDWVELVGARAPERVPWMRNPNDPGSLVEPEITTPTTDMKRQGVHLPVVCLEGYGETALQPDLWARLRGLAGAPVYLDGRMTAGGVRRTPQAVITLDSDHPEFSSAPVPERIGPGSSGASDRSRDAHEHEKNPGRVHRLRSGLRVRVSAGPRAGRLGTVAAAAVEPFELPGGRWVWAARLRLDDDPDRDALVPVENVEAIVGGSNPCGA